MKVIFLDFDGVLVNRESLKLPRTPLTGKDYRTATAHPSCVEPIRKADFIACWCREGATCHADILLELANQ